MTESVRICAVGDIRLDRDDPESAFDAVQTVFSESDIRFGNCEGVYSDTTERNLSSVGVMVSAPTNVRGLVAGRFDVMSYANNHALGTGYRGFFETIDALRNEDIGVVGAGKDRADATKPFFLHRNGLNVGFLAYTCVYPPGFEADANRPGCATLKIHTIFREEVGQPGNRPQVLTLVDPGEKQRMLADVRAARSRSDLLVVSMHWGIHTLPTEISDYERELGHALIDEGADMIVGHHQHILKGVEVYKSKPIFYGLGNFVFDSWPQKRKLVNWDALEGFRPFYGEYLGGEYPAYPSYPFHPEARLTSIARVHGGRSGPIEARITPCKIRPDGRPSPISKNSELDEYVDYMARITRDASLTTIYGVDSNELVIELG